MAMRMAGRIGVAMVVALVMGSGMAWGAVAVKDDLKGCALPHGEAMLPVAGTFEAATGEFLKLSDGSMVSATSTWQGKKAEDVGAMQRQHVADLAFLPEDNGTLWAVSGRIVDLGAVFLSDVSGVKMDQPEPIPGFGGKPSGMIKGVQEGRTFLVETTEGKFALVRVLEVSKVGAVVQWVYQPAGGATFDVPKGELVEAAAWIPLREPARRKAAVAGAVASDAGVPFKSTPAPVSVTPVVPAPAVAGATGAVVVQPGAKVAMPTILEPPFSHHMRQREMMIETRMKILKGDAKTPAEIEKKVDAINELAEMHADVAADEMVRQIAFLNPRGAGKEFQESVHPCFAALKKLGKAGSDAAVKGLRTMELGKESEGLDSPSYRAGLLALVIRAVEGDDVGLYILRRDRAATLDDKRQAMYDQLINPEVKNVR